MLISVPYESIFIIMHHALEFNSPCQTPHKLKVYIAIEPDNYLTILLEYNDLHSIVTLPLNNVTIFGKTDIVYTFNFSHLEIKRNHSK